LKRAQFLASTTVDFQKGIEFKNRTNITTYNKRGVLQENLTDLGPDKYSKNDLYCNKRGDSYIVYFYLICERC